MKNKLFLICPFSSMEPFIRSRFGDNVFFLTAMAGFFTFQEEKYLQEVKSFIAQKRPERIYLVNDTSCRFLNGIVRNQQQPEVPASKPIQELFQNNFQRIMRAPTLEKKVEKLAELSIARQTINLIQPNILGNEIMGQGIQVRGLITNRLNDDCKEMNLNLLID